MFIPDFGGGGGGGVGVEVSNDAVFIFYFLCFVLPHIRQNNLSHYPPTISQT